jgi:hypothetical protein
MSNGFRVDLSGLHDFSARLRANLDGDLLPEGDAIGPIFQAGVPFGFRSGSPSVQKAATDYHERLAEILRLMDAFLHNSEVMVQTAQTVLTRYQDADDLAHLDLRSVISASSEAVTAGEPLAASQRHSAADETNFRPDHGVRS